MEFDTREECRRDVATRGLTPDAVAHLTRDALGRIELENLAPVKRLLKQFFSDALWTARDDDALAALVGPGRGWWEHDLGGGCKFAFGWRGGTFRLGLERTEAAGSTSDQQEMLGAPSLLEETFEGAVVPEATPNPRTIRFVTGELHRGPSRWYASAAQVDDPRVTRLFSEFDDVANVLVGPDFVAVGIRRPDRWEQLLGPMLRIIAAEFPATSTGNDADTMGAALAHSAIGAQATGAPPRERALDHAWSELRTLKPDRPDDRERILAAASSPDISTRQVAARVLIDVDAETAARAWSQLLDDSSRAVRRATVDAMVDTERPALHPLLERALGDSDAWTRWKALRGLVELGVELSRDALTRLAGDPDFRVRLEAAAAMRSRTNRDRT